MRLTKKTIGTTAVVLGLALGAGACGVQDEFNDDRGIGDAPTGEKFESERDVIVMPDKFHNLALVCVGDTLVIAHTRPGAAPAVAQGSSWCDEGNAHQP